MEWTKEKEEQWKELTKIREENKNQVTTMYTVDVLKDLINKLEKGEGPPYSVVDFEYIRHDYPIIGYENLSPIVGIKISIMY